MNNYRDFNFQIKILIETYQNYFVILKIYHNFIEIKKESLQRFRARHHVQKLCSLLPFQREKAPIPFSFLVSREQLFYVSTITFCAREEGAHTPLCDLYTYVTLCNVLMYTR